MFDVFGFQVEAWQLYVALSLISIVVEIAAPGFVFMPIGIAFAITALAAVWVPDLVWHLLIFFPVAVVVFWFFKNYVHSDKQDPKAATNVDHMIGQRAKVVEAIDPNQDTGYIKLYGDQWRAVNRLGEPISTGQWVVIQKVEGNRVIVEPEEV